MKTVLVYLPFVLALAVILAVTLWVRSRRDKWLVSLVCLPLRVVVTYGDLGGGPGWTDSGWTSGP